MTATVRTWALAAATTACLALTACGDDSSGEPTTSRRGALLTAPGATLQVGESARVPVGDDGVAELTVTRIEPGRRADLAAYGAAPKASVSYVWIEVSRVSGDVTSFTAFDHLHGWAGDDLVPHVLTAPKPFAPCPARFFPNTAPTEVLETCTVFTNAVPIDRVGFHDGEDYRRNEDEITWR